MANSVSNFFTIAIALYGAKIMRDQNLPSRFTVGFLVTFSADTLASFSDRFPQAFAIVGVGSFAFHATLLYTAQLADELPMIFSVSSSLFIVFDTVPGFKMTPSSWFVLVFFVVFNIFFSWS